MSIFRNLLMELSSNPTPNLRHIQIGDNLKNKTLYFEFPDDVWDDPFFPQKTKNYSYFAVSTNLNQGTPAISASNNDFQIYMIITKDGNARIVIGGYNYNRLWVFDYEYGETLANMTEVNLIDYPDVNGLCDDDIAWIDTTNPIYQYIWVDANEMGS